jgi:hypothetical protein
LSVPMLEDVFKRSGLPTFTFVQPAEYEHLKVVCARGEPFLSTATPSLPRRITRDRYGRDRKGIGSRPLCSFPLGNATSAPPERNMIARRLRISAGPQIPSRNMSAQTRPGSPCWQKKKPPPGASWWRLSSCTRDPSPKERSHRDAAGCGLIENERGPHQN